MTNLVPACMVVMVNDYEDFTLNFIDGRLTIMRVERLGTRGIDEEMGDVTKGIHDISHDHVL